MIEVYADLLFLINAGMDGLCFGMTGCLFHRKLSPWRVLISSILGGVYAVTSLFLESGQATALLLDVGVCAVLCTLAFWKPKSRGGSRLFAMMTVYILLSMTLGGVMTVLYNFFNRIGFMDNLPAEEEGIGVWLFAVLAILGSIITLSGGRFLRRAQGVRQCRVTVEMNGKKTEADGLIDTGNLLKDPLSGKPVICADRRVLRAVLSLEMAQAMEDSQRAAFLPPADACRLRLIPAKTATGHSVLTGFLPDRILISFVHRGGEQHRVVDAVVASTELNEVQVLVPAELIH